MTGAVRFVSSLPLYSDATTPIDFVVEPELKELGVEDVAFSKAPGLSVEEMVKSSRVYRFLRNFRAGVEGVVSFLKRSFGLDRCTWSGLPSFKAYVQASVLACNLLVVARNLIADSS